MRGRERELQIAAEFLSAAERGRSGMLLIEGEPGIGKSEFISELVNQATSLNFSLATARADILSQQMPFAPLLAALRGPPDLPEPLGRMKPDATGPGAPDSWMPAISWIRTQLEHRATASPLLVSLDDLQYADAATLFALRVLRRQLVARPLAWVLARCVIQPRGPDAALFDLLGADGATRLALAPLASDAVTDVIRDILGASPDGALAALASGAAGNPLLLVELLLGLRDENAIRLSDGIATLVSTQLPRRVHAVARGRLEHLRERTRHLVETAAVLGLTFRLEDVAEVLGNTPAVVLPLVNEAVGAGFLTVCAEYFGFRHELIWRAVTDSIPQPARQALHRQFGELLLARGGAPMAAAAHLLNGARQGDPAVMAGLDAAAEQVLRSSPQTAADLALRALELTEATDPARAVRTMRAAGALVAAARLDEAVSIVHAALAEPQPPERDTELRCALTSVLCLQGEARQARTEAEALLSRPYLTGPSRDEVLVAYLQALTALGENGKARAVAEAILAAFGEHGDPALAGALSVLANICWNEGRLDQGLHLASEAVRRTRRITPDARHFQPLLGYAARLVDLRQIDKAEAVIRAATDGISGFRPNVSETIPPILRARIDLAAGHVDSARAEAELALGIAGTLGTRTHSALAHSVLSVIALRRGDLRAAGLHLRKRPNITHYTDTYAKAETLLAHAQFVEAEAGPETAMKFLGGIYAKLPSHRHVLIGEPTASAWLARTALAVGRAELATGVAHVADELAQDNPAFDVITAAAAHCGGIVGNDPVRLAHAAAIHPDPWARASASEDLGMVLAAMTDHGQAVLHLDDALGGYSSAGAERDLARVRRKLRRLGVRRRHWVPAERPAVGWASLTETELATCDLVAQGLSNQQVAEQMYVSVHTVAFHLRQVFRKLGIGSRVELARLVAEQPGNWDGGPDERERYRGRDRGLGTGGGPLR
jgi:DNA-binding CsgD family transcriptional regulator/tetratricopeptide (TPR) repeat protein